MFNQAVLLLGIVFSLPIAAMNSAVISSSSSSSFSSNIFSRENYPDQLFSLIRFGSPKALSEFLKNHEGYDIDFLYGNANNLQTPLECAVNLNDITKVSILQRAGAKLDQGDHARPLLLIALMNENAAMIEYLARFNNYNDPDQDGIDINFHNSEFFWPASNPEMRISREMRKEFYKLFDKRMYKFCNPQDELLKAACIGRTSLLDRALSKGAQVNNYGTDKHDVALNIACAKARVDAIAHLINRGANVNLADELKGRSALHWVIRMHKEAKQKGARYMSSSELLPCSFLLMCAGADPRLKDKEGKSVYYWVEELPVSNQEKRLLRRILNIPQLNSEQRETLLGDIYDFQVEELRKYVLDEGISVPPSCGARYFWHRPECIRMKNAWVRKDKKYDTQTIAPEFKDIYQDLI